MFKNKEFRADEAMGRLREIFDILAQYHPEFDFDVYYESQLARTIAENKASAFQIPIDIDDSQSYYIQNHHKTVAIKTGSFLDSEIPDEIAELSRTLEKAGFKTSRETKIINFYYRCENDVVRLLTSVFRLIWEEHVRIDEDFTPLLLPDFFSKAIEEKKRLHHKTVLSSNGKKKNKQPMTLLNLARDGLQLKLAATYPEPCKNRGYIEIGIAHSYDPKYQKLVDKINGLTHKYGFYLE